MIFAKSAAMLFRVKDPFSKVVGELFRKGPVRSFITLLDARCSSALIPEYRFNERRCGRRCGDRTWPNLI